jgi:DMSO reductase anchor subunit
MLVLTQLSVGAFAADLALRALAGAGVAGDLRPANAAAALVLGLLALGASVLHLGRPHLAWRAVIGLRHSWLSREIVAFCLFAGLAVADAGALALFGPGPLSDGLGIAVVLAGGTGVACSVMIYAVTGRAWWRGGMVAWRFTLTTAACGLATTLAVSLTTAAAGPAGPLGTAARDVALPLALVLAAVVAVKLASESVVLQRGRRPGSPLAASARLLLGPDLAPLTRWRFLLGAAGGVAIPLLVAALAGSNDPAVGLAAVLAVAGAVAVTAGELAERTGFFAAAHAPAMPRELP